METDATGKPEVSRMRRKLEEYGRGLTRRKRLRAVAGGVESVAKVWMFTGVGAMLVGLGGRVLGMDVGLVVVSVLGLGVVGGLIGVGGRVWAGCKGRMSEREAAERLDQELGDHNVVAAALEFSGKAQPGVFESATIRRGLVKVEGLMPSAGEMGVDWRLGRVVPRLVVALAAAGVGVWISGSSVSGVTGPEGRRALAWKPGETGRVMDAGDREGKSGENVSERRSGERSHGIETSGSEVGRGQDPGSAPGGGEAASSGGKGKAEGVKPSARVTEGKGGRDAGEKRSERGTESGGDSKEGGGGKGGQGGGEESTAQPAAGAGGQGGTSQAESVPSATEQKAAGKSGSREAGDSGQSAQQSGGEKEGQSSSSMSAPMRQDRSAPGSRELGQSGLDGSGGSGRGGPSEGKKARGAGAIFMSLPIPDFVAGKLSEGMSRMTRRKVPPRSFEENPSQPGVEGEKATEEGVARRYDVPAEESLGVGQYLDALRGMREASGPVSNPKVKEK